MKKAYLKYYETYSSWANLVFLRDALTAGSRLAKQHLLNRQRDYLRLHGDAERLKLHWQINKLLLDEAEQWPHYSYGGGYHYQSFAAIGLSGLRDTQARAEALGLENVVAGRSVLDIGCNTGFLDLTIAHAAERIVGFDINPHLIEIGRLVASHLGIQNVSLGVSAFEDVQSDVKFDVVLSLANHATVDGNTRQSVQSYFDRCGDLLVPGGVLVFESHPPSVEGETLKDVVAVIEARFRVEERRTLHYGTFLDRGRTFIIARARD